MSCLPLAPHTRGLSALCVLPRRRILPPDRRSLSSVCYFVREAGRLARTEPNPTEQIFPRTEDYHKASNLAVIEAKWAGGAMRRTDPERAEANRLKTKRSRSKPSQSNPTALHSAASNRTESKRTREPNDAEPDRVLLFLLLVPFPDAVGRLSFLDPLYCRRPQNDIACFGVQSP